VRGLGSGEAGFLRGLDLADADARLRAAGRATAPAGVRVRMAELSIVGSSENLPDQRLAVKQIILGEGSMIWGGVGGFRAPERRRSNRLVPDQVRFDGYFRVAGIFASRAKGCAPRLGLQNERVP